MTIGSDGTNGSLSRRGSFLSRKGVDGESDDIISSSDVDSTHMDEGGDDSLQSTPVRKRRVSVKAMTALRFPSLQADDDLNNIKKNHENAVRGHIRRVLSDCGVGRDGRFGDTRNLTPWRDSDQQSLRFRQKEKKKVEENKTKSLYNDLSRLINTAKKEESINPTPFGVKDVRRRLVDELYAIRVGQTPHKYQ
jgi:hypothetical protein